MFALEKSVKDLGTIDHSNSQVVLCEITCHEKFVSWYVWGFVIPVSTLVHGLGVVHTSKTNEFTLCHLRVVDYMICHFHKGSSGVYLHQIECLVVQPYDKKAF